MKRIDAWLNDLDSFEFASFTAVGALAWFAFTLATLELFMGK